VFIFVITLTSTGCQKSGYDFKRCGSRAITRCYNFTLPDVCYDKSYLKAAMTFGKLC